MTAYSMPAAAPLYPPGPYAYDDCTSLLLSYPVDGERLASLVPDPLSVRRDVLTVGIHDFGVVSGFGAYHELTVAVPVAYADRPLSYSLYLLLDGDAPTAGGREVWGVPKKMGAVSLDLDGAVVTARAARGGVTLCEATFEARHPATDHPRTGDRFETVYRKTIPAASAGSDPVVDRLVIAETRDVHAERALAGPATLSFSSSAADPLGQFEPDGAVSGFLIEGGSWVLDRVDDAVLHRYAESD